MLSGLPKDTTDASDMEITNDAPDVYVLSSHVMTDAAAGEGDNQHDSDAEGPPTSFQTNSHESFAPQGDPPSVQQSIDSQIHMSMEESIQVQ
jgi:hypothetical protein